jgi:hypothetical protein
MLSSSFSDLQVLFNRQRREYQVFTTLLQMIPGLEDRLVEGSEEGVVQIADLVRFTSILERELLDHIFG